MRRAKKLIALFLAAMMVMGLSMTVLADENTEYTITIKDATASYIYEAYQVFKGDLSDGKLTNIEWGSGISNAEGLLNELKNIEIDDQKPFDECGTVEKVAEVLAKAENNDHDSDVAKAFAEVVGKYLTTVDTNIAKSQSAEGTTTITVKGDGYYLVKNKDIDASGDPESSVYTRYLLLVTGNTEISHKGDAPTATKEIVEDDNQSEDPIKENEASIGDTIEYKITGTLPSNIEDYNEYYYVFTDTLSKGLTFSGVEKVTVTVDEQDVTKYFYISATEYDDENGTTITIGMDNLLTLNNELAEGGKLLTESIDADTEIVITYFATLNEDAIVGGEDGNTNKVKLEYSNDPNNSGDGDLTPPDDTPEDPEDPTDPDPDGPTGNTPEDTVTTYTTSVTIFKVDGTNLVEGKPSPLAGAAFRITGTGVKTVVTTGYIYEPAEDGNYYKLKDGSFTTDAPASNDDPAYAENANTKYKQVENPIISTEEVTVDAEAFVNNSGQLTFAGLGAGNYTISEIVAPEGYNSIKEDIEFTITFEDGEFSVEDNAEISENTDPTNTFKITIQNFAGSTLPSTGGMGTTIFYIVGGVLVLVAVVLLVTRKRMKKEEV